MSSNRCSISAKQTLCSLWAEYAIPTVMTPEAPSLALVMPLQGLYTELGFEKPSQIQAQTLPLILQPPYKSLIAQVRLQAQVSLLTDLSCHLAAPGIGHMVSACGGVARRHTMAVGRLHASRLPCSAELILQSSSLRPSACAQPGAKRSRTLLLYSEVV